MVFEGCLTRFTTKELAASLLSLASSLSWPQLRESMACQMERSYAGYALTGAMPLSFQSLGLYEGLWPQPLAQRLPLPQTLETATAIDAWWCQVTGSSP